MTLPGAFRGYYVPISLFENVPLHVKEVFAFLNNTSTHVKSLLQCSAEQQWCCLKIQMFSVNMGVFSVHVSAMQLKFLINGNSLQY